jgi:pyruvate,water dikinase
VAFTLNPVSGSAEEIVINASWGLGEAVVSGRVTPDSYVVRKADGAHLSREVFDKEIMVQPDPTGASGTVLLAVPAERRERPALDAEQISSLAALCLAVERAYGAPQDIEWALRDGTFYLLQSRPITAVR